MKPAHKLMHWYREWSRVQNARVCGSLLRKSPPRISRSPGQHAPRSASKTDLALNVTYGTGESGHRAPTIPNAVPQALSSRIVRKLSEVYMNARGQVPTPTLTAPAMSSAMPPSTTSRLARRLFIPAVNANGTVIRMR